MRSIFIIAIVGALLATTAVSSALAAYMLTPTGTGLAVVRTATDEFHPPSSSSSLVFGGVPNMTVTTQTKGPVKVQLFSQCAVSVSQGGYGVLLWVRLKVDGVPTGAPANQTYPGVHELCGLTSGGSVVTEGYRATIWTVNGLSQGSHTFLIEATLAGFSSGVLTGPGPGTDGSLSLRTMIVDNSN